MGILFLGLLSLLVLAGITSHWSGVSYRSPSVRHLLETLICWNIGIVFVFVGLGTFFICRVTRTLRQVAEAAENVAQGQGDFLLPASGSVEEKALADSFNRMIETLDRSRVTTETRMSQLEADCARTRNSYEAALQALARILDNRDNETDGHSQRVAFYSQRIAQQLGLENQEMEDLKMGALMHDIGKVVIPDSILRKPGNLTVEEMLSVRRHCQYGVELIQNISYLDNAAEIVRCHHEMYDGSGYPNNLQGDEIPLIARIFSVADTLEAMTSGRPYRSARSFSEALEEIQRCSGTQFDPQIVAALEAVFEDFDDVEIAA